MIPTSPIPAWIPACLIPPTITAVKTAQAALVQIVEMTQTAPVLTMKAAQAARTQTAITADPEAWEEPNENRGIIPGYIYFL